MACSPPSATLRQAKPSDLLPELQGRLPVRVALKPLGEGELRRILQDTRFNLLMQQRELLATEVDPPPLFSLRPSPVTSLTTPTLLLTPPHPLLAP
jgi:hypothetical protein